MYYDFKCSKCDETQEVDIPISQYDELKEKQFCEKCGEKMTRVWEPISGTIYKAKGFYDTDVRGVSGR